MQEHRLIGASSVEKYSFGAPFSCFEYVEREFGGEPSIHRCFSLARSSKAKRLLVEDIPAGGIIAEENEDLAGLGLDNSQCRVRRVSFWRSSSVWTASLLGKSKDLIGYAILKRDKNREGILRWHVFESVFEKYAHHHNCVLLPAEYDVALNGKCYKIKGVLYCQQNGLNKACAQVALRSLLSRLLPGKDVSYRQINRIAAEVIEKEFDPASGLFPSQIRGVLRAYKINFRDVDYEQADQDKEPLRKKFPYQTQLYSGVEAGVGALLGFSMDGPKKDPSKHIIPFYGHTFNKDTWVPDAQDAYLNIGGSLGYISSGDWTSSFIGHDDNFGPNFCVPRYYMNPEQVQYVLQILHPQVAYDPIKVELFAQQFFSSLHPYLDDGKCWQGRLKNAVLIQQKVVLRTLCVSAEEYKSHLRGLADWNGNREDSDLLDSLFEALPARMWMVEISLPHLFPANERKLGEILFDGTIREGVEEVDFRALVFVRLPCRYFLLSQQTENLDFSTIPSKIDSHTALFNT